MKRFLLGNWWVWLVWLWFGGLIMPVSWVLGILLVVMVGGAIVMHLRERKRR